MNNDPKQASILTPDSSIYIAGHRGMVGSAIKRRLEKNGFSNILFRTHDELDLCNQSQVNAFFNENKVDYIVLAAAKVGGIHANNTYPAEFIYRNLMMEANVIHGAWQAGIDRLLFLGSSCIYPKMAKQPMSEDELLTGSLESTNEPYAIAKIAGIKLCESYNRQYGMHFRSVMPTNLYGPNDNFHPENSHVIPALLRRIHEAKVNGLDEVVIWGTGNARREFLHVDDMASACLHVMGLTDTAYEAHTEPMLSHINVGTGVDISIRELAEAIQNEIGFEGRLVFDTAKPDGTPKKLLDVSRLMELGWKAGIELEDGLAVTYQWFLKHQDSYRK
jgi:GDP-L-fucose synthase